MTIQDLGSIGEFVAAIATLVTLGYLAIQIRQLSKATRAEAARGTRDNDPVVLALAQDPALNELFVTGLSRHEDLTPLDQARFAWVLGLIVGAASRNYHDVTLGILDERHFMENARGQLMFLETSGGAEFWRRFSHTLPPAFRAFVERELDIKRTAPGPGAELESTA